MSLMQIKTHYLLISKWDNRLQILQRTLERGDDEIADGMVE
jgi:hypothetical protein